MTTRTSQSSSSSRISRPPAPKSSAGFAFGSSTPRDLSHQIKKSTSKTANGQEKEPKRDIIYYMRQARSIEGREQKGTPRSYAFGSSTPRSLSHLSNIAKEQRVYDAKLVRDRSESGLRQSATNPQLAIQRGLRPVSSAYSHNDEDAASEPDIVQDRMLDFGRSKALLAGAGISGKKKESNTSDKGKQSAVKSKQSMAGQVQQQQRKGVSRQENKRDEVEAAREAVMLKEEVAEDIPLEAAQNHTAAAAVSAEERREETLEVRIPRVEMMGQANTIRVEEEDEHEDEAEDERKNGESE